MNKYEAITQARKLLELPEQATMAEIKTSYRRLMHRWHPDRCGDDPKCLEMAKRVIEAYKLLIDYCRRYKYSFTEEEVHRQFADEEWWTRRFGEGPC